MALIQCPSCNKRISSKAASCPHCDFTLAGRSQDDLERAEARARERKREKLLSQSMLALLASIIAFAYSVWVQPHPDTWQAQVSYGVMGGGVLWFLINRVRLIMVKRGR